MKKEEVLELINNLEKWHKDIVTHLQMVANADDRVKIQFRDKDGNYIDLPDDKMPAFKAGVSLAIHLIKEFPVVVIEK
ncbi:hypothetical protein [Ornithobacterium rhinotracheale]|uniref:hypothetical protein n=1 Tax=Ornithobacterium rhinotracheale TaxID=28251 RepID=UPI001FF1F911|nr:hypothetical protein [Ornithobacterium rhinotracheale]MCK0201324.1 hypothetical protein [Ornithobacterium rhinotracheale]